MFANDTLIYISGANPQEGITKWNYELQLVSKWLDRNFLSFNVNKTKYRFGNLNILEGAIIMNIILNNKLNMSIAKKVKLLYKMRKILWDSRRKCCFN